MKQRYWMAVVLASLCIGGSLVLTQTYSAGIGEYDPWADINDDGKVNILDCIRIANAFGTSGTPLEKASIEYDSGWITITDKCEQYFNITHNLNSTDIIVDITGKTNLSGEPHQMHLGLTGGLPRWTATFDGQYGDQSAGEVAYSIVQTSDGGYGLAGIGACSGISGGYGDILLVKTDWTGRVQWNWTYNGYARDLANSVIQTSDGGYALAGYEDASVAGDDHRACLVKIDSAGHGQWSKIYYVDLEPGISSTAESVIQTSDGGYVITGYITSFNYTSDCWLVKTDNTGEVQWEKTYGGIGDEVAYDVIQTEDGGYMLVGVTNSFGAGGADVYLVKTDSNGDRDWNHTYGMAGDDCGYNVVRTSDGGYAISCSGFASLIKTDSNGNMEWNRQCSESGASWVIETAEGGYALAAGGSIVKVDCNGNVQWTRNYGGYSYCVVQTADGAYACAGFKFDNASGTDDFWLARTEVEYGLAWTGSSADTVTLYRGATDPYWNYVRVRILRQKQIP